MDNELTIDEVFNEPLGSFALLPIGRMYNTEVLTFNQGDKIAYYSGEEFEIESTCLIDTRTVYADALCRIRYGVPILKKISDWKRDAVFLGHTRNAVSSERCVLITYKSIEEDGKANTHKVSR